jgi:hypothetical protein
MFYSNMTANVSASLTVNITDNDAASVALSTDRAGAVVAVDEGGPAVNFSVALTSEPTSIIVVRVGGFGRPGLLITPDTLTYSPQSWNTKQTMFVACIDDDKASGDTSFNVPLNVFGTDPFYGANQTRTSVIVRIADDDFAGMTALQSSANVVEGFYNATMQVHLASIPIALVQITMRVHQISGPQGLHQLTVVPNSITIHPLNWNVSVSVSVGYKNDILAEETRRYLVAYVARSGDPTYNFESYVVNEFAREVVHVGVYDNEHMPEIDSIFPPFGPFAGETALAITGRNFLNSSLLQSRFGDTFGACYYHTSTLLRCVAPALAPQAGPLVLLQVTMNGEQFSPAVNFTYFEPPVISAMVPNNGLMGLVTNVTIDGAGFSNMTDHDARCRCNSATFSAKKLSATQVLCQLNPTNAGTCEVSGVVL